MSPDGTRTRVPIRHVITGITRLGDGFLVLDDRNFEGYVGLSHVIGRRVVEDWSTTAPAVVGPDGAVAWGEATSSEASVRPPPALRLEADGVRLEQRLATHPVVVGIVGRAVVYTDMFASANAISVARVSNLTTPPVDLPLKHVVDVDEVNRRILGQVGTVPPAVMELDGLHQLWNPVGRDLNLVLFSPDGTQVLAWASRRRYAVVEAETGKVTARFLLPRGTWVSQHMWETNHSVLMVLTGRGEAGIVRVTMDGTVERVVRPLPHRVGWPPYALEQRA